MLNLNSPQYNLSATTTSASITLAEPHVAIDTLLITNTGASSVFVTSGQGAVTAVYPSSSGTAFQNGSIIPVNQSIFYKKNPTHETIAMIRPSGASAGDVCVKVGAEI